MHTHFANLLFRETIQYFLIGVAYREILSYVILLFVFIFLMFEKIVFSFYLT